MTYDIKNLTIDEKISMLVGMDKWHIQNCGGKLPSFLMCDGPCGLRKNVLNGELSNTSSTIDTNGTVYATAMPSPSSISYTWDPKLSYLSGYTIADECIENEVDMLLAPGVNIKRTPLCGRNFEYFSEDPYLAGVMAKAFIEGVQDKGVGTSLKHYCLNNREFERLFRSSEVDERTLREIYLPAFEMAIEAKPWSVMCAYNMINGVWAGENKKLLNNVLREEFGFDGVIVSDWGAIRYAPRAIKASLDLIMPYNEEHIDAIRKAYEKGELTEEEIDARIEKLLALLRRAKSADRKVELSKEERHENAVKIARDAIVLLKNDNNCLPLKNERIFVTGQFGDAPPFGGGGSAKVSTSYKTSSLSDLISTRLGDGTEVVTASASVNYLSFRNTVGACAVALDSDSVVICVGNDGVTETEGYDRTTLKLKPHQEDYIKHIAKYNNKVTVVIYAGGVVDISDWVNDVDAVVLAGFAGEGVNEALADILTGRHNPSAKLTETWPYSVYDTPTGLDHGELAYERYTEGLMVGYRWYDHNDIDVLFPFGHGLSYASFKYSDMKVEKIGECDFEVSFNIKNTSDIDAKEIAQVYVSDLIAMVERPKKELRGFAKIALKAGEEKRVSVKLGYRSFAYYSTALDRWHVENGHFDILVGASSRDIRLSERIKIELPEDTQFTMPTEDIVTRV